MITWIIIIYLLWVKIGLIRFFMLMGRKNHKDTLFDKVIMASLIPMAHLMGLIAWLRRNKDE